MGSAFMSLRDNLGFSKATARWVPKLLLKKQTGLCLTVYNDFLARHKRPEDGFLHNIVSCDETDLNPNWCPNNGYKLVPRPKEIKTTIFG